MTRTQTMDGITDFQQVCEQALRDRLHAAGYELRNREIRWIGEPAIYADIEHVHIWIYVDEAEVVGTREYWIFEKYDYRSPSNLIDAFVERVLSIIQRK